MVKDEGIYLIDPASLFEKNHKTFLGAPIFFDKDNDVTFLYGFLKDFLTIRYELKIRAGIVLISKECLDGEHYPFFNFETRFGVKCSFL